MAETTRPPTSVERPLSPHLQIYRIQMTSVSSILTRLTGNGIIVAVALAVWWLLAAAVSDSYFAVANAVATSWFGDLVFTLALWGCGITTSPGCGTSTMTRATGWTSRQRKSWAGPASSARSC